MSPLHTVAFLGNYAPRCCGIATFTQDLRSAVCGVRSNWETPVAMVSDDPDGYAYPEEVRWVLAEKDRADYRQLARAINESGVGAVTLQHEYGIFGGDCGDWLLELMEALEVPVVTTCHTVLKEPNPKQLQVLRQIARRSANVVVMAEKGREFLENIYDVPKAKVSVIHHGIPDLQVSEAATAALRTQHGWGSRRVIMTFGLLSPNKGIEYAIRALPAIVRAHPDALYVVVGATHPNLVREHGDVYRASLKQLVAELGLQDHVQFIDRFVTREELVALIAAADIYTTPYLNEAQITSGTLAYAFGLGKAVVSTPYWYAAELLGNGAGVLVPFRNGDAMAEAVVDLLSDDARRTGMAALARTKGGAMSWREVGRQYADLFERVAAAPRRASAHEEARPASPQSWQGLPPISLRHLHRMSGSYGIYQHARLDQPDPRHGFCTDDNARVVIFLTELLRSESCSRAERSLLQTCLTCLWNAYNEPAGRFRNFMNAEGHWLESKGSEDSHGRALWALGHLLPHLHHLTEETLVLFREGLAGVRTFTSPRAWAFSLLGLAGFRTLMPQDTAALRMQEMLADRLVRLFRHNASEDWQWFENVVTYDNAKLPQALLMTARQLCRGDLHAVGLKSLEFLLRLQTAPKGHFRPVGCQGFMRRWSSGPAQFDQQPLEAQAMVAACIEAERSTGDHKWLDHAQRIYGWFHGDNDVGLRLADVEEGACYDGLQPNHVNLNQGAESTLAYLQATVELRSALACQSPKTRLYFPDQIRESRRENTAEDTFRAAV